MHGFENVYNIHFTTIHRYVTFFRCCECINSINKSISYDKRMEKHQNDPDKNPAPKRFKRKKRTWDKHSGTESSTEDTDEDHDTGGLGRYSHGSVCLSHQHWVRQAIAAGSFGVHNTQGPEAFHKKCVKLASSRVRHYRANDTRMSMMEYLFRHRLFTELSTRFHQTVNIRRQCGSLCVVKFPLIDTSTREPVEFGGDFRSGAWQSRFLHPEVRVARVELLDLLCDKLSLPKTVGTYQLLGNLQWTLGQKLTTVNGDTYWSTDTQYPNYGQKTGNRRKRRDIVSLDACEDVQVVLSDGTEVSKSTRLYCETVCFFTICGLLHALTVAEIYLPREVF